MRVALAIAAALAVATSAAAQTGMPTIDRPVPARLTLQEALSRAIETSHILAELRAREGAATAVLDQRKASDMPALSAQAGYRRTNHVEEFTVPQPNPPRLEVIYPDVPDNWRTRLDLAWPIYTGGRTGALEHAADAERLASGKDLESAHADLVLETTRAFWALVTATESVRVVGESITRIEAQHSDVKARFDTGSFLRTTCSPSRHACRSSARCCSTRRTSATAHAPCSRGSSARAWTPTSNPRRCWRKAHCRCRPAPRSSTSRPTPGAHALIGRRSCFGCRVQTHGLTRRVPASGRRSQLPPATTTPGPIP
jgi:hypothetical protein